MKITTIVFTVSSNSEASQIAYEKFINLLALREYSFTVNKKSVSSTCRKFYVEVDGIGDGDIEYAVYKLGGTEEDE